MERSGKRAIAAVCSALLISACAAAPGFVRGPAERADLNLSERAAYYALYRAGELDFQQENDAAAPENAGGVAGAVMDLFQIDGGGGETVLDSGETHYTLDCGQNGYIRLTEYYKEWDAAWHNWFIITLDSDTGAVYHFYASSMPLQTLPPAQSAAGVPETLDEMLADFEGITGLHAQGAYAETGNLTYTQAFSDGESEVSYAIKFNFVQDRLMDVEMTIQ